MAMILRKNLSYTFFKRQNLSAGLKLYSSEVSRIELNENFYDDSHREIQNSLKKIIETHINPYTAKWEEEGAFPSRKIFKLIGRGGFFGINKPVEFGGLGLSYKHHLACMETMSTINASGVTLGLGVQTDGATPHLEKFGSQYLKETFLAPTIKGDMISSIGITEPSTGSDVSGVMTTAKRSGDDLIINGQKMWITNGCEADWISLLANTSQDAPHKNKSLICVPMNTPGVSVTKIQNKLGMRCSDTAHIFFDEVRVPAKNIIGEEGHGFQYQMFQGERIGLAVMSLVQLQMCINETIDYITNRKIFGVPIVNNQAVHYHLAEMQTELESIVDDGGDATYYATMCKLKAGRLAREITDGCLQYWGAMGFTDEVIAGRLYRDLRLVSIGGGADEVMLSILCKFMRILPGSK